MRIKKWKLASFFEMLKEISGNYFTYRLYPISEKRIKIPEHYCFTYHDVGMVIQGPVIADDDFTENTIKIYRKLFPGAVIVLSTWKASEKLIHSLTRINVKVIINKEPANPGISNINRQIKSTKDGLAALNGCTKYAVKLRSDQRLTDANALNYLINIFKMYGQRNDGIGKIMVASRNTFKYRLYGISDMFQFGYLDDLIKFWDCKYDNRPSSEIQSAEVKTLLDFARWSVCEVYLVISYLKRVGIDIDWTLLQYRKILVDFFVVFDSASLGLYWHKYSYKESLWKGYSGKINGEEISFSDWLLYASGFDMGETESLLRLPV